MWLNLPKKLKKIQKSHFSEWHAAESQKISIVDLNNSCKSHSEGCLITLVKFLNLILGHFLIEFWNNNNKIRSELPRVKYCKLSNIFLEGT